MCVCASVCESFFFFVVCFVTVPPARILSPPCTAGRHRVPTCKLPSRLHNRWPAMTESPATKPANGDVCQRVKNGLKPERNGLLKSLHRCHERQSKHHCHPEEEEVRPGMGRGGEAGEAGEASTAWTRKQPGDACHLH